jgi:hypothetical protein
MPLTAGNGSPSFTGNPVNAPDDANGISTAVPGAPPNLYQGANGGGDPLTNAIQAEQAANPQTVSVNAPTKLSKLLNIALPILEGGLIGAAGGKGHPGGGFGFANQFYAERRQQQLQQATLQRQAAQTQAAIQAHQTSNDLAQQKIDLEDWGNPFSGQDADGNPAFFVRNRRTGETKQVNGATPLDKSGPGKTEMTDQGLVNVDGSTATPVTIPGPSTPPSTAMVSVRPNDPNSPRVPAVIPGSQGTGIPLRAPNSGKQPRGSDFNNYYQKYLSDNDLEDSADNELDARSAYMDAGRKPINDGSDGLTGKAYVQRQSQYLDQLNRGFASSEAQRTKELNALAKDPTLSPDELAEKKQEIEEENADRKQTLHDRIHDAAAGQNINLGSVPDYRAQLTDNGQNSGGSASGSRGLPSGPPNGARSNGAKVAYPADIGAWAAKQNISIGEARRQFKAKGYELQGNPQ